MTRRNIEKIVLLLAVIALPTTISVESNYPIEAMAGTEGVEQQQLLNNIPKVTCIYQGKAYYMAPFTLKDGQRTIEMGFPVMPDNIEPQMTIEEGQTITMKYEKSPTRAQAFLADYDADAPVRYPLKEASGNTFTITPEGTKTLVLNAMFPGNLQVSYSILLDVDDNT